MTSADQTFYGSDFGALQAFDPDIAGVLLSELGRIRGGLQLIASENMSSPEVLTALGSTLAHAQARAYEAVRSIRYTGAWYRRDIADRAIKARS